MRFALLRSPTLLLGATTLIEVSTALPKNPLFHEPAAEDLYTLFALVGIRLPHLLWAPFAELAVETKDSKSYSIHRLPDTERLGNLSVFPTITDASGVFAPYWDLVTRPNPANLRLRRALGRAFRARHDYFAEDALLDAWVGLETLFSRSDEQRHYEVRLSKRVTQFLLNPYGTPDLISQLRLAHGVRRSYAARSAFIHGGVILKDRLTRATDDATGILDICIAICLEEGLGNIATDADLGQLVQNFDELERKSRREYKRQARKRHRTRSNS